MMQLRVSLFTICFRGLGPWDHGMKMSCKFTRQFLSRVLPGLGMRRFFNSFFSLTGLPASDQLTFVVSTSMMFHMPCRIVALKAELV